MKINEIDDEQMCCCLCGYIGNLNESYETEYGEDLGCGQFEEFPICPKCGGNRTGGYSSYARAEVWQKHDLNWILELNNG